MLFLPELATGQKSEGFQCCGSVEFFLIFFVKKDKNRLTFARSCNIIHMYKVKSGRIQFPAV
jgi:hypothetical protein